MTNRSTFTVLFPVLATLVAAPSAHADLENVPPVTTKPLPAPHNQHARCHPTDDKIAKQMDNDWYCGPIRASERGDFTSAYKSAAKNDLVDVDGKKYTGVRNAYDRTKLAGTTSEPNFTALAWLSRYKPPMMTSQYFSFQLPTYTSAHQDWESTTNNTIDDCNEYAYKRYYGPNRFLDTLGQLVGQRRYEEALDVVLETGIPSVSGTHALQPLENRYLVDYDNRVVTSFSPYFSNTDWALVAPLAANRQVTRNPFFGMPFYLAPNTPPDGTQDDTDFRAAYAKSLAEPLVSLDAHGEFGRARAKRVDPKIHDLTNGEREDIARREKEIIDAVTVATQHFNQCLTREWISISAVAPTLSGKTAAQVRDYLEQTQPSMGYTYPIDQVELQLQSQLLDTATSSTVAHNILAAPLDGTSLISQMARTRTGSLLRLIASLDNIAAQSAFAKATTYTVKSGAFDTSSQCALGDDFQRVRDLLVDEWRRPDHGCLSSTTTKCDFSAPLFLDGISARLSDRIRDIDTAKAQCVKTLGSGNFDTPLSYVAPTSRTTLAGVEGKLRDKYIQIQTVLRDAPRSSSLPHSIGDRRDGGSDWGDGTFAAGYHYSGEWGVNVVESNKNGACRLGGKINGSLTAYATAFGARQDLVDAGLTAVTQQPDPAVAGQLKPAQFQAHVKLLGFDLFTPIDETSVDPSFTDKDEGSQEIDIIKTTVFIGPVPVSISVGFEFDYGYTLDLRFNQVSICSSLDANLTPSLGVTGTVTPHAGAAAVVSAYVDLFIAGAGVKGKLTLVDAKLPFAASVSTKFDSTNGFQIVTDSSVKLILTELSGSLSFIVNLLGITVWEAEFFSWDGFKQTINLWDDGATYPINTFNSL